MNIGTWMKSFYDNTLIYWIRTLEVITCLHIIANTWRHWNA